MKKKIAVLFPGIGYTCDKPLLYYTGKLAVARGYKLVKVEYGNFPSGIKENKEKMEEAFRCGLERAEKILQDICWEEYEDILFVSKSIGTVISSAFARRHQLSAKNILFTPGIYNIKETLKGIKFSRFYLPGNAVLTSFVLYILIMLIEILNIPLYTDLILVNLELIFYILFLIQGVSVAIFFTKKWLKAGHVIKFILGIIAVSIVGIMGISILGMVDSIFDFRKVKSCELI